MMRRTPAMIFLKQYCMRGRKRTCRAPARIYVGADEISFFVSITYYETMLVLLGLEENKNFRSTSQLSQFWSLRPTTLRKLKKEPLPSTFRPIQSTLAPCTRWIPSHIFDLRPEIIPSLPNSLVLNSKLRKSGKLIQNPFLASLLRPNRREESVLASLELCHTPLNCSYVVLNFFAPPRPPMCWQNYLCWTFFLLPRPRNSPLFLLGPSRVH